jgi:hypothetical protein
MKVLKYNILDKIITEGRLEDMIKKYAGKHPELTEESIRQLSAGDPSGNNKYLDWMCNQIKIYTSQSIIDIVKCFHDNINRLSEKNINAIYNNVHLDEIEKVKKAPKDINSYESPESIQPICTYFEEQKPETTSRIKIYEDDKWLLVSPLTHDASCKYGVHSNWCVSTSTRSYYDSYTKDGILVFFIDKKGTNPKKPEANSYKFAVYINFRNESPTDWEWYSMEDKSIDPILMLNFLPKNLIDKVTSYFNDILKQKFGDFKLTPEFLNENSLIWLDPTDYETHNEMGEVYLIPKITSWGDYESSFDVYKKLDSTIDIVPKEDGITFLNIVKNGLSYNVRDYHFNWEPILKSKSYDSNEISMERVLPRLISYSNGWTYSAKDFYRNMSETNQELFKSFYINMFNDLKMESTLDVRSTSLNVGDTILHKERGSKKAIPLKVIKISEKSISLSNGKKIVRNSDNWRVKISSYYKVV